MGRDGAGLDAVPRAGDEVVLVASDRVEVARVEKSSSASRRPRVRVRAS
jgi:hypothetical protein